MTRSPACSSRSAPTAAASRCSSTAASRRKGQRRHAVRDRRAGDRGAVRRRAARPGRRASAPAAPGTSGCLDIRFGAVHAHVDSGCFLRLVDKQAPERRRLDRLRRRPRQRPRDAPRLARDGDRDRRRRPHDRIGRRQRQHPAPASGGPGHQALGRGARTPSSARRDNAGDQLFALPMTSVPRQRPRLRSARHPERGARQRVGVDPAGAEAARLPRGHRLGHARREHDRRPGAPVAPHRDPRHRPPRPRAARRRRSTGPGRKSSGRAPASWKCSPAPAPRGSTSTARRSPSTTANSPPAGSPPPPIRARRSTSNAYLENLAAGLQPAPAAEPHRQRRDRRGRPRRRRLLAGGDRPAADRLRQSVDDERRRRRRDLRRPADQRPRHLHHRRDVPRDRHRSASTRAG